MWAPLVYKWAAKGINENKVRQVIGYALAVVLALFGLAGVFSWIVDYILPEQYAQVPYLVVACMVYPLLYALSEATKVGIGIKRKTGYSMLAAVIAALVNVVGNYMLVPAYGAAGAAISTAVAFYVFFVLRTEFAIKVWIPLPRLLLYSSTLLCVVASILFVIYGERFELVLRGVFGLVLMLAGGVYLSYRGTRQSA